jgi:two-component system response regulator
MKVEPIRILLVEDSAADIRLIQEALREGKIVNELHIVRDGEAALDFLYQRHNYSMTSRPDLVILDLNLPRKNGKEVLEVIKADESLRTIPVTVLTTSSAERDVIDSYKLGANCYMTKPVNFERFIDVVNQIEDFWLGVVRLPIVRNSWA